MAKLETVTFAQAATEVPSPVPENYTHVTGIYTLQVTPQFLNARDNIQHPAGEMLLWQHKFTADQQLRFFRVL